MAPVIRIDYEVMNELKKRAKELDLVFEPPNITLRVILGLDKKVPVEELTMDKATSITADTQCAKERFGKNHSAKVIRDTKTNREYSSMYKVALAFPNEFPAIDRKYACYAIFRKYPGRFIEVKTGRKL